MTNQANSTGAPTAVTDDSLCICPMCHTVAAAMTVSALETRGYWLCTRCDQEWDASRLATRAAYTDYAKRERGLAFAGIAR